MMSCDLGTLQLRACYLKTSVKSENSRPCENSEPNEYSGPCDTSKPSEPS